MNDQDRRSPIKLNSLVEVFSNNNCLDKPENTEFKNQ